MGTLLQEAIKGVPIQIKVDGKQYNTMKHMLRALDVFRDFNNVSIYTVIKPREKYQTRTKTITTIPEFHDKLILIEKAMD